MMRSITLLSALLIAVCSYAQDTQVFEPDYRITIGTNFRYPVRGAGSNSPFPLMGFKKNINQKTTVGGINVGVSRFFPLGERLILKANVNLSRQVYWDKLLELNKGPQPQDNLGQLQTMSIEYYLSGNAIVHFPFGHFSTGAGLGVEGLLTSTRMFKKTNSLYGRTNNNVRNREYKPIMPVIPIEFSWKGDLMLYNIRYEAGLFNRYRNDLSDVGGSHYGLLCFEIGMIIQ